MVYKDYFPIVEYYRRVVIPVNPKRYWVKSDKMMVCPLHDDINPSMGIMLDTEGNELYHCFGCNRWGNVVDLHKKVSRQLFRKYLSDEESLKDLCRIFSVPYDEVSLPTKSESEDVDVRRDIAIREAMGKFDISDFRRMMTEGKVKKKRVAYFNTLTMIMVNEIKQSEV